MSTSSLQQHFITQRASSMQHVTQTCFSVFSVHSISPSCASGWTGMADAAAVADGVEEAAVAGVTEVTARQLVTQTRLLVRDAAPRRAHGATLELRCCRHVLKKNHWRKSERWTCSTVMDGCSEYLVIGPRIHQEVILHRVNSQQGGVVHRVIGVASLCNTSFS